MIDEAFEFVCEYLTLEGIEIIEVDDGVYDVSDDQDFIHLSHRTRIFTSQEEKQQYIEKIKTKQKDKQYVQMIIDDLENNHIFEDELKQKIKNLCVDKKIYCGNAYQKYDYFLFGKEPKKMSGKILGDGFEGHGTTAVLQFNEPYPKAILILGEND